MYAGNLIGQSTKLFTLVNMNEKILKVYVAESEVGKLEVGQPVKLSSDFLRDREFEGRIKRISPVVDPESGTFTATVELLSDDPVLRPGMFLNVQIILDTRDDAVLVPKKAVVYESGVPYVFAVEDTVARRIRLDIGFENSYSIEALSDIAEGDEIIVVGQSGLKDLAKVKVVVADGEPLQEPDTLNAALDEAAGIAKELE